MRMKPSEANKFVKLEESRFNRLIVIVALLLVVVSLSLWVGGLRSKIKELDTRCELLCNDKMWEQENRIDSLERLKKHFNLPDICRKHEWRHAWDNIEARPDHGGEEVNYCSWCGKFKKFKTPKSFDCSERLGPFEYTNMTGKSKEVE